MEDDSGLLGIGLSSAEDSDKSPPKPARDHQSEAAFQEQKSTWKPKIENGKIWKSLTVPVDSPSKPESQAIAHAVEELYFFKDYATAEALVLNVLQGQLQEEFRSTLEDYLKRCRARLRISK